MTKTRSQKRKQTAARKQGKRAMEARQAAYNHAAEVSAPVEDVRVVVLQARRRHMALAKAADPDDNLLGCETGRAIRLAYPRKDPATADPAKPLWDTWCELDIASETHHRLVIGKSRFPAVLNVEYLPEVFEVRHDGHIDLRTHEQKVIHAKRRWGEWCNAMSALPILEHDALRLALWRKVKLHDKDMLTGAGRLTVLALRRLSEVPGLTRGRVS